MKKYDIQFELSYTGSSSDAHEIDFYDVSQALIGFQRSLAITTHLVLNDTVITQAPSLKGAQIYALPAEEGSWKIKAGIFIIGTGTAGYHLTTAPNNTPLGHLVYSAYDYVISQSLGFNVDYDKTLGQLYEESKENKIELPEVRESQLDSVIEKCSVAITEMHRPIYKTKTATSAAISTKINNQIVPLNPTLSLDTFQYIIEELTEEQCHIVCGFVSGYNSNTYKGRLYVPEEKRSIPFILTEVTRGELEIQLVVDSLKSNALRKFDVEQSQVFCKVHRVTSKSGQLKSYKIVAISSLMFGI